MDESQCSYPAFLTAIPPREEEMTTHILGISAYYHDSAACLLRDGQIIAAAQQERFTRKKFDAGFPDRALSYCLREGGISVTDLHSIVFYDQPLVKFERLLETYRVFAPRGVRSLMTAIPAWLKDRLHLKSVLEKSLAAIAGVKKSALPPILFGEHHKSHAASAFYPSPFSTAAVLCMDATGECATTSAWLGQDHLLTPLWEMRWPHSLVPLYAAFAHYAGFKVNSGAYKVMGLAPYGKPKYVRAIYNHLMDLKADGTFRLNMEYFNAVPGHSMTSRKCDQVFGGPARPPGTPLTQREMD